MYNQQTQAINKPAAQDAVIEFLAEIMKHLKDCSDPNCHVRRLS